MSFKKILMFSLLLGTIPTFAQKSVELKVVKESFPTYQIGNPEVDPIFFTGRVYQGAEGYIYPYPLYDIMTDNIVNKEYEIVRLENEYISLGILPEIGGRIFQAQDLTNDYHFFYEQTGVKPALIGMLGAWLSGGVEWNIPDHHRPSSYMLVDWTTEEHADGSKTIWVGESELRHRLKWSVGITIFPNSSRVEASVKVINPTPMVQSMLYWANVSVHCNEQYRVIFPPDVQAGTDHSKVYFTHWPMGSLTHGADKSVDVSWWKNFTLNSRSIFAWDSKMGFLAGYDYGKDAGTVHVANRFQVPGKKFFLWGNNKSGHMWNKILSDKDGHYLELMVGAYSDNQPDYSWIAPGEIREFKQTWFPIKGIQGVKNATENAAVNFEPDHETGKWKLGFNTSSIYKNAKVLVTWKDRKLVEKTIDINPDKYFLERIDIPSEAPAEELNVALLDAEGNVLVGYTPVKLEDKELPKVIDGTKPVKEYKTVEELYLAGLRVDQFNNARLSYMDFYNEALSRDSMDARVNIEVGKHYIRQAEWDKAEKHLLRAKARLEHDYTRAFDTEANYYIGYVYRMTGRRMLAEENLWAATYTPTFKHPAYYQLAVMATEEGNVEKALGLVDEALLTGAHDLQALTLKSYLLRKAGQKGEAKKVIDQIKSIDPLDYWSEFEQSFLEHDNVSFLASTRSRRSEGIIAVQELLEVVNNYLNIGDKEASLAILDEAVKVGAPFSEYPLVQIYRAYSMLPANKQGALEALAKANTLSADNNFPLRVEEVGMFNKLVGINPDNYAIHYYLGNLLYYLGQKDKALAEWYKAVELNPGFALAQRNIGFGEGVKANYDEAIRHYDIAIQHNPDDPLLLAESDKLCEKANIDTRLRQRRLEKHLNTVLKYDDAVMRLLRTYNANGEYKKAAAIENNRHFHLWEGGGEIHSIYEETHMRYGESLLAKKQYAKAIKEFELATLYPTQLEVSEPNNDGCKAKAYHLIGKAYEGLGKHAEATGAFTKSANATTGSEIEYMCYKALSLRQIGREEEARELIKTIGDKCESMGRNLMDSYAKFGEADAAARQKRLEHYKQLLHDLMK